MSKLTTRESDTAGRPTGDPAPRRPPARARWATALLSGTAAIVVAMSPLGESSARADIGFLPGAGIDVDVPHQIVGGEANVTAYVTFGTIADANAGDDMYRLMIYSTATGLVKECGAGKSTCTAAVSKTFAASATYRAYIAPKGAESTSLTDDGSKLSPLGLHPVGMTGGSSAAAVDWSTQIVLNTSATELGYWQSATLTARAPAGSPASSYISIVEPGARGPATKQCDPGLVVCVVTVPGNLIARRTFVAKQSFPPSVIATSSSPVGIYWQPPF